MTEGHTERLEAALAGRYKIERKLGEGGMASVYLAEDLKHERKVALKILRPELAAVIGAERFLSEIKTTANLQHPHILALFDSGQADGYLYYVMPYIDGETLRAKLDREKQLGVDEAVRIARDVADALDYAHRHGVIHRDIKPGNILLHDGRPVVADFGIALAVSAAGGGRMTETGLSLGTPHYMSPEQASADRDLSARSDVYSLGCVLYEMLAGQPPHTGPSAQSILVHILTKDVTPLTELRHTVPTNVASAVARSIEKLPADRFETAKAFLEALEDPGFTYQAKARTAATPTAAPATDPSASPWHRNRRLTALGASVTATAFFAALAAWGWLRPSPESSPAGVMRFTIEPPEDAPLSFPQNWADLAIAPTGDFIVYKGPNADNNGPQLYVRTLDDLGTAPLRGADGAVSPAVSPNGQWVTFVPLSSPSTLQRVSSLGGTPVTLAESENTIYGVTWAGDDEIIFGGLRTPLFRIPAGGGEPEPLTTVEEGYDHLWPSFIEGRNAVLFVINPGQTAPVVDAQLAVLDLESGEVTEFDVQGVSPRYVPPGYIVYAAGDGSLRAVPFDAESLTITGSVVPLIEGVALKVTGAADFDVSADGHLVYALGGGSSGADRSLVWVDRNGLEEPIAAPSHTYVYPRISPDGRRVALDARDEDNDIWIWDFAGETLTRMVLGDGAQTYPVWTPDGSRIAYNAGPDIYWKAANNTGDPELLVVSPGAEGSVDPSPYFFSPDGAALVLRDQQNPETDDDLLTASLGSDATVTPLLDGSFRERNAELSPSGRWMAYQSDESGRFEVYVRPFPDMQADQVQVSNNGGIYPVWRPDGSELIYVQGSPGDPELVSVPVDDRSDVGTFVPGSRSVVMGWPYASGGEGRSYDVSPDGSRFLAIRNEGLAGGANTSPQIQVVLNWLTELRERMGER